MQVKETELLLQLIIAEARRKWRHLDKAAPGIVVSQITRSGKLIWYTSIIRHPEPGKKIVEAKIENEDLDKALAHLADGFVPWQILRANHVGFWPTEKPCKCIVCGSKQYMVAGGITCLNGHGGSDSVMI